MSMVQSVLAVPSGRARIARRARLSPPARRYGVRPLPVRTAKTGTAETVIVKVGAIEIGAAKVGAIEIGVAIRSAGAPAMLAATGAGLLAGILLPAAMRTVFGILTPVHDQAMLPELGLLLGCIALANLVVQLAAEAVRHRSPMLTSSARARLLAVAGAVLAATVFGMVQCHLPVTPVVLPALLLQFGISALPALAAGTPARGQWLEDWITAANAVLPVLTIAALFAVFARQGAEIGDSCEVVGVVTAFILASGAARLAGDGVAAMIARPARSP